MKIGVVREVKDKENRVGMTPDGVKELVDDGHSVVIEKDAGIGSGFGNEEYEQVGAQIVAETAAAWDAELIVKVKEPLEQAYPFFKDNIIFTYLHLSGVSENLTQALLDAGSTAIGYETVENGQGRHPLLAPMSAVAGNMAATMGAYYLAKFNNGKGVLLGDIFYERHGKVMVLGDGVVGQHAATTADGMGAFVYLFGLDDRHYREMKKKAPDLQYVQSTPENIAEHIKDADLVVGAILRAGAKAPHIVSEEMVQSMQPGSVIVDVSIDQGGCIETSRPTKHSDPVYVVHDVIHYCVTNMPGAYPRTSTIALTNATLPYVKQLANLGIDALKQDASFAAGVNTYQGWITCEPVAEALGRMDKYKAFAELA